MQCDDTSYLLDMLVAARDAVAFADGLSYAEFTQDKLKQLAILKSVEILGEAASRVSQELKDAQQAIPWRDIVGMRNRLVHVYFDIDLRVIWDTVCDDLPILIDRLEPLVPPEIK